MWQVAYQVLLFGFFPLVWLRLKWRARREPGYSERLEERFGHVAQSIRPRPIWFHTVSAGETIAAAPLIESLVEEFGSRAPFLVTTMTPTGSQQVLTRLAGKVDHCYAPYDFLPAVRRFYESVQPRLLILMETELWPNLIAEASRRGIPVLLVNARLSARSAKGYQRISGLTQPMLKRLSAIACQFPDHVRRFVAIGADPQTTQASGSVKFDISHPTDFDARREALKQAWSLAGRRVWIAGSTHPGEDELMIQAHLIVQQKYPDACLILVPRHPVRCDAVCSLVQRSGLSFARQSDGATKPVDVIVGDTMGQLVYLYGLSDVAFLAGSFNDVGGHNPIEAAICGQPMIMGPQVFNFEEVVNAFEQADCLRRVSGAPELADELVNLFGNESVRRKKAQAALAVVNQNRGALLRVRDLLVAWITRTTEQ
ncbi:MAG: lipid IV(A) 3-deoxy-D-manno-octulosonic acid transferase [Proteobacteria bacterium]|nr:lipid IV(A) 3-deoxy-D-manno-octulosonic acid transferase [Pseudomonadota bacterium]